MSDTVIKVEGLGKKYRIRHQQTERYTALRDVIARKAKDIFKPRRHGLRPPPVEDFWALKDVGFEVKRGEVLGIIGRNGAGKSTLLKVLSRITEPTEGRIEMRGRVASLLEVGTGFHPELTGRENIFLNGAILGMGRGEIRRKFDEIVAFAEVEKFLDTPVKRYSSGMYVRLAFAVAAHLEPEILVVDEVLAVGDAEFQKKCLGKMDDVSKNEGRTVLFVSHNMAAVKSLTKCAIVLSRGVLAFDGKTDSAIQAYVEMSTRTGRIEAAKPWGSGEHTTIKAIRLIDPDGEPTIHYEAGQRLRADVEIETDGSAGLSLDLFLTDANGSRIGMASTYHFHGQTLPQRKGNYICHLCLEPMWLASGRYGFDVATAVANIRFDHYVESAMEFDVPFSNPLGHQLDFKQSYGFGTLALLSLPQARFVLCADDVNKGPFSSATASGNPREMLGLR
jgi:lipopolysaccharide transport system ATP-binding protein